MKKFKTLAGVAMLGMLMLPGCQMPAQPAPNVTNNYYNTPAAGNPTPAAAAPAPDGGGYAPAAPSAPDQPPPAPSAYVPDQPAAAPAPDQPPADNAEPPVAEPAPEPLTGVPQIDQYADENVEDTAHYDPATQTIDNNYFYDRLAPFGDWVPSARFGYVWVPRDTPAGWRPYSVGHWAMTDDYGWMWVSDERWGWATYHYGRWYHDDAYGWAWTPGTQWAPAWVVWRHSPTHIGWAPIPPDVRVDFGADSGFHIDMDLVESHWRHYPYAWCFVSETHFIEPEVGAYIASPVGNTTIIQNTTVINNYTVVNNNIVNNNINVLEVERLSGRRVPRMRVEHSDSLAHHGRRVDATTVAIFAPKVNVKVGIHTPPAIILSHVDVVKVKQRHEVKTRDFDTRLVQQEKEIKAGRRKVDDPAPETIVVPSRDRRPGRTTAAPVATPRGGKTGRVTRETTTPVVTPRGGNTGRYPRETTTPAVTPRGSNTGRYSRETTTPVVTPRGGNTGRYSRETPTPVVTPRGGNTGRYARETPTPVVTQRGGKTARESVATPREYVPTPTPRPRANVRSNDLPNAVETPTPRAERKSNASNPPAVTDRPATKGKAQNPPPPAKADAKPAPSKADARPTPDPGKAKGRGKSDSNN